MKSYLISYGQFYLDWQPPSSWFMNEPFNNLVLSISNFRFLLGTASPVLHKILYSWDEEESNDSNKGQRHLILSPNLEVSLTLVPCYDYYRLELEGIPPIAMEALLEYIYKD